jgi:hypothetical protein
MSITVTFGRDTEQDEESEKRATPEKLKQLCEKHVRKYQGRIHFAEKHPDSVVDPVETEALLLLWQGMIGKVFEHLTEAEQQEVLDALDSGE